MKKIPRNARFVWFAVIGFVVVCLGLTAVVLQKTAARGANPNLTDSQIAQDLAVIEEAVWKYGKLLPEHIDDISPKGLKGNLRDYQYQLVQQYEGGPGESFALCGTFHARSAKLNDPTFYQFSYDSPEVYTYHTSGMQCYSISWDIHGGRSSVGVMNSIPDWAKK